MATRLTALLAVLLLAAICFSKQVQASEAELQAGLKQLLTTGWKRSFQVLKPAEEEFEQLQADFAGDPRPAYALALVQLKHRRYTRARELLTDLVAQSPDDHHARQGLIWTLMITKKYEAALVHMDELMRHPPIADEAAQADEGLEDEGPTVAEFVGRMFGFLEGPGAGTSAVLEEDVIAQRDRTLEALPTGLRDAFNKGRDSVLSKFDELSLTQEEIQAKAKAQQEKENERLEERLEAEKEVLDAEKSNIDAEARQAEDSASRQLGDLEKQLATCDGNLAKVNAAGQVVRSKLDGVLGDLDRWSLTADTTKDPILRNRAIREIAALRIVSGRLEQDYAVLDSQAATLIAQRNEITAAAARVQAEYEATMKRLGRTANKIRKNEKRIGQDERKLDKPVKGNTAEVRNNAAQVYAFSTYDTYPLEQEKRRLLTPKK
ncbi:MAG: hypothetical protein AB7O62_07350 [Pirellulales bacterium]